MPVQYGFNGRGEFIIDGYDKAKTFASFLPGIAGTDGIPMWAFYCNRGQVLGSFGVRDKNGAIMEFQPAHTMYRNIERQGFRTFVRIDGKVHELYSSTSSGAERQLVIGPNLIRVIETNHELGISVTVTYFTMPGEPYAALVRKVGFERLGGEPKEIEILDGLAQILPYGVSNGDYQAMANLMKSWFDVFNMENGIAFYKVRASTADTAEVSEFRQGNFYLSFSSESKGLINPIYDMDVIFGANTALAAAEGWDCPVEELIQRKQVPENKVSGGFTGARVKLAGPFTLYTVIGHAASPEFINGRKAGFTPEFIERKQQEAEALAEGLVQNAFTRTGEPLFDRYIAQCYLDNVLRGGYPLVFEAGSKRHVYHIYSRKHGDTEREYNFFSLEPGFYSQGNGNFRDVNQNRRCDVLFNPAVGDFNVKHFMSLIQADGYNPLQVKGCTFRLDDGATEGLLALARSHRDGLERLLTGSFTPGLLVSFLAEHGVALSVPEEEFLNRVLEHSAQQFEAEFGEGYWSDHWTYNMDLVDSYLAVFPDRKEQFLFGDNTYRFFQSPVFVLPRSEKYVCANGRVRQYGSIREDGHGKGTAWLRSAGGNGAVYETNLFAKLLSLALMKFVNLDPFGMGIEMEGGRPGWNDALNGLPGLFGSGVAETAELLRMVDFLHDACRDTSRELPFFAEAAGLLRGVVPLLKRNLAGGLDDFAYWDGVSGLKEKYREAIRHGIGGAEMCLRTKELLPILEQFIKKLKAGLEKALGYGGGLYPTYFSYEATEYEFIEGKVSPVNGHPNVRVTRFDCRPLPAFLEGPARILKLTGEEQKAEKLYDAVKASGLYDSKLGMYKTSGSLEETGFEIGRLKAFTPGWLERESVFLHMEYKYLYAMLKAGLYDRLFEDMKTALVPFMDPAVYGRSTLENSSFIASSANPDGALHGRGFVARLSGSTAEMLIMWFMMMAGREVFSWLGETLSLKLSPILPGWLFGKDGRISFMFLGSTAVTYINPQRRSTYGPDGVKPAGYRLVPRQGGIVAIEGSVIGAPWAEAVRNGEIAGIEVNLQ